MKRSPSFSRNGCLFEMDDDEDDNNHDVEDEIFGRPAKVTAQFQ